MRDRRLFFRALLPGFGLNSMQYLIFSNLAYTADVTIATKNRSFNIYISLHHRHHHQVMRIAWIPLTISVALFKSSRRHPVPHRAYKCNFCWTNTGVSLCRNSLENIINQFFHILPVVAGMSCSSNSDGLWDVWWVAVLFRRALLSRFAHNTAYIPYEVRYNRFTCFNEGGAIFSLKNKHLKLVDLCSKISSTEKDVYLRLGKA